MADDRPLPMPDSNPEGEESLPPPEALPPLDSSSETDSLPELSDELRRPTSSEPVFKDSEPKLGTKQKIALGGLSALIIVGGLALVNPWTGVNGDGPQEQTVAVEAYTEEDEEAYISSLKKWYEADPALAVAGSPEPWSLKSGPIDPEAIGEEQSNYFLDKFEETRLAFVANSTLPLEANGFTSDTSEAITDDDLPNPMYSYLTAELFQEQTGYVTEKLLNPYFGGWGQYQFGSSSAKKNFDTATIEGLFTERYQKENFSKGDKSFLPVLADWNGNNYGRDDLIPTGDARWVGEIVDADVKLAYDSKTLGYRAEALYDVKFSAKTLDQKTVTREGRLRLTFVTTGGAGADNKGKRVDNLRLLVDSASLTVS